MKQHIGIAFIGDMGDAFAHALATQIAARHKVDLVLIDGIAFTQTCERLATTEGVTEIDSKRVTRQNIVDVLDMLNKVSGFDRQLSSLEELIMELHAMPPMEPIIIEEKRAHSNIGAYKGYKPHPTKASDRKRFERFNKKRR